MGTTTGQNHVPQVDTFHDKASGESKEDWHGFNPWTTPTGVGSAHPSTPQGVKSARKGQQGFCLLFKTFFGRIVCDITVDVADVAAIFNMEPRNALCGPCRGVGVEFGGVGGESASDRRTGAVGGVCGAEQVIEKWRVGEVRDEQGYECVSRETQEVWNTCSGWRWETERTGEVECGGIVGNRGDEHMGKLG